MIEIKYVGAPEMVTFVLFYDHNLLPLCLPIQLTKEGKSIDPQSIIPEAASAYKLTQRISGRVSFGGREFDVLSDFLVQTGFYFYKASKISKDITMKYLDHSEARYAYLECEMNKMGATSIVLTRHKTTYCFCDGDVIV